MNSASLDSRADLPTATAAFDLQSDTSLGGKTIGQPGRIKPSYPSKLRPFIAHEARP